MAPTSVFAETSDTMFQRIEVEIETVDRLAGGQPRDKKLVEGWIRTNAGVTEEEEVRRFAIKHLTEMGVDPQTAADYYDGVEDAADAIADMKTMGFKVDDQGRPCIEARHIKAGIKESVNILFGSERWGPTRKGAKGYTAERVFVEPGLIPVADGPGDVLRDVAIGHHTGPKGPTSTLTPYEYVVGKRARFVIRQLLSQQKTDEPALSLEQWAKVFSHMEWNGLGAMRSQGFGQFVTTKFAVIGE